MRPERREDQLRHILKAMVDAMGPTHSVFDGLLAGDALERCMDLYMRQADPREHSLTKEYCLTRVRACVKEILSKSRTASMGEVASAD